MMMLDPIMGVINVLHGYHDAWRIKRGKRIYHGINAAAYLGAIVLLVCLITRDPLDLLRWMALRQLTFDIPLNLFRGKSWHYNSTEITPKSITDQFELLIFQRQPGAAELTYFLTYIILLIWI